MSLTEQAMKWLSSGMEKSLSVPAEYVTISGKRIPVQAVIGRTLFRAENEYGQTILTETRDFLVPAESLPDTPLRGEHIRYGGRLYEVLAPNGEPCWRWSDPYRNIRRIHTKETANG